MNAMIFAAGLGTRLRPLTESIPKALVKVNGKPLLQLVIERLKQNGVENIVINTHHFSHSVVDFLKSNDYFGVNIRISEEENLLDTGGGLAKAKEFFDPDAPVLLHNVDVISNFDLKKIVEYNSRQKAAATLLVRNRRSNRYLLFDENYELIGWENIKEDKSVITRFSETLQKLAFSGISFVTPLFLEGLPESGSFSIIDAYLQLADRMKIVGLVDNISYWFDVGTIEKLKNAEEYFKRVR